MSNVAGIGHEIVLSFACSAKTLRTLRLKKDGTEKPADWKTEGLWKIYQSRRNRYAENSR